jgi:aminopeptidase
MDLRLNKLANTIVNHSLKLKKGSKVLVRAISDSKELVWEIIEESKKVGAYVYVEYFLDDTTARLLAMYNEEERMEYLNKWNNH